MHYDYLLVHSGNVDGPPSLHPAGPHRSGELLVKRPLIESGVNLMMQKSIIECEFSAVGIRYHAGNRALAFLDGIRAPYVPRDGGTGAMNRADIRSDSGCRTAGIFADAPVDLGR